MAQPFPKKRIIKRLGRYYLVEGFNTIIFLGIMIFLNILYEPLHLIFLSYGLLLMCFILAQGTWYWWAKWSILKGKSLAKFEPIEIFKTLKRANIYGILLIPFVLCLQWFISGQQFISGNYITWAILANAFAVLEHINYYYRQLMYDNLYDLNYLLKHRSLKKASLYKDLRENKF